MSDASVPAGLLRRGARWSYACLTVTVLGAAAAVAGLLFVRVPSPEFRESLLQDIGYLVPYGLAGAFLIRRRPDLPFGCLLAETAGLLALATAAEGIGAYALLHGRGGDWPVLLVESGGLEFLAVAVQGFVNVRFPTGRIESRLGRALNVVMVAGVALLLLGGHPLRTCLAAHDARHTGQRGRCKRW